MGYEQDDLAEQQAMELAVSDDRAASLSEMCSAAPAGAVAEHRVRFNPQVWADVVGRLPDGAAASGSITRGDVFAVAAAQRSGDRPASDLFLAAMAWGFGATGYGKARYDRIVSTAGDRLEPALLAGLGALREDGAVGGYAQFFGGYGISREPAGAPPWSRLAWLGPAFFTKLLYFADPDNADGSGAGALILDNVLANRVHDLSGMPHVVAPNGRSEPWTAFRYAVYLHWMRQTAQRIGVAPDLLEVALFGKRLGPDQPDDDED
jgi:hypothetical protein